MKTKLLNLLLIIALMSACADVNAQESLSKGLIIEDSGASRVAAVSVFNKRTAQTVNSTGLGLFEIRAAVGDTLEFSKSGYNLTTVVLSSLSDLVIRMQPIIELAEVKVRAQTKRDELEEVKAQYRKKGSYYAGKPPLLAYIFKPLTTLYELLGKTPGQAKRFNQYYIRELEQSEIDRRFNSFTVSEVTGLQGADLKNFVVIYRPGYDLLAGMDEYALIRYIKQSLITFNNSGRPKGLLSLPALPKAPDLTEKNLKY